MYDAIVVGAGPGGSTAAAMMAREGLRVLLVDKATFPRDKVCGDAISKKAVLMLERLGIAERLQAGKALGSYGITLSGTEGDTLAMTYYHELSRPIAPSFVSARAVFDKIVFDAAVESGAEVWQNTTVEGLILENGRVMGVRVKQNGAGGEPASLIQNPHERRRLTTVKSKIQNILAPLVIGADGAYSVVARELGITQLDEDHYCAGVRAYYEGVIGFHEHNHIEVHFLDELLPGYFWIFPLPEGRANVGIGMLSSVVKKKNVRLKQLLQHCVEDPRIRDRFAEARIVGGTKGWGLPLGSKPRTMAGSGWMLVGDAASLIDPFAGEGIGNAMLSGAEAARWAVKAREAGTYTATFLSGYERDVMAQIRNELRLSYAMQKLGRWTWLLNAVIRKASRSQELTNVITRMIDDESERRKLVSPLFYLRLLKA